jgi:hypothetical protein
MKYLVLLLSFNLYAQTLEFDKGDPDIGSFKTYKLEDCARVHDDLNKCMDASISYTQPASTGINGYEGKCGQTAAANITSTLCKENFSPIIIDDIFRDITPGVHPRTLVKGMNKIVNNSNNCPSKKSFTLSYAKDEKSYIEAISNSLSPVAILIRNPGGQVLHWVSVFQTIQGNAQCSFLINHWGGQYQVPCHIIAKWSRGVKDSYGAILRQYTLIF